MEALWPYLLTLVVGIILLLIEYRTNWFSRGKRDRQKDDPDLSQAKEVAVPGESGNPGGYKRNPTPYEIMNQIRSLPPYQREVGSESYKNVLVDWSVVFHTMALKSSMARLMLHDMNGIPWVYCLVSLTDYPELKIIKEGHRIRVWGEIERVRGNDIFLKKARIEIL